MPQTQHSAEPTVWHYKPWWCQPWSILLTGCGAIAGSWFLFHRYWLTGLVGIPLTAWMVFFVGLYPQLAKESGLLEEMKKYKETAP